MELISSWTFAVLGITLLFTFDCGSTGAIIAYAVGNLLGCLYGIVVLAGNWRSIPNSFESLSPIKLGRKVAPFALGLWFINIVSNLFDLVDRYMIIHFANVPAVEAQQLVGQYFSSLAIPVMMIGVGTTLAHLTMPYLSEDWEAGRQGAVSDRINFGFKLVALMLAIGATGILLVAPIVFERVFDGRYEIGQAILPISITFCCWAAISMMANNYLYCVERPRLILCATVTGLLTNVAFNAILLPVLGLFGAALATAFGWLVNLVFTLLFSIRHGLKFDRRVAIALSFPLVLPMGSAVAVLFLIPLLVISVTTNIVFTRTERVILYDIITDHLPKVPWRQVSTRAT